MSARDSVVVFRRALPFFDVARGSLSLSLSLFCACCLGALVPWCPGHRYGGAVGLVGFDGHLNTGLTLRTIRVKDGTAEAR